MNDLHCDTALEWIVRDLDEGLNAEESILLDEHLRLCPDCRRFKEETATVLSVLPEDTPPEPDEEFWSLYRSSLHAKLQESAESRPQFWTFGRKFAALTVCASLATIVILLGGPSCFQSQEPWQRTEKIPGIFQELRELYGPVTDEVALGGAIPKDLSSMKAESHVLVTGPELMTWYDLEYETNAYSF